MPFLLDYTCRHLCLQKLLETRSVLTCPRTRAEEVTLKCLKHFFFFNLLSLGKVRAKARQSLGSKDRRLFRDQCFVLRETEFLKPGHLERLMRRPKATRQGTCY